MLRRGAAAVKKDDGDTLPTQAYSLSRNGLSKRHNAGSPQLPSGTPSKNPDRLPASRAALSSRYKERSSKRKKNDGSFRWVRSVLIAGIPAYIMAILFIVGRYRDGSVAHRGDLQSYAVSAQQKRAERSGLDDAEWKEMHRQDKATTQRGQERAKFTRPPRNVNPTKATYVHDISHSDKLPRKVKRDLGTKEWPGQQPAHLDSICGYMAQTASLQHPENYVSRDSIHSKSSVLITGILSPLGYQLALTLHQKCNVETIIGMDAMFPNTFENRMEMQEPLQILTTNVPKFGRPLLLSQVGVDPPKLNKASLRYLETTGELDLVSLGVTHIVHLASYGPELFRNREWEFRNLGSPFVLDDYDPPLYPIRQSMTGMEQILASLAQMDPQSRPRLVYATSSLVDRKAPSRDEKVHRYTKMMDEVLADTYYQFHDVFTTGLRLPNHVYGGHAHPMSETSQILRAAVTGQDINLTSTTEIMDLVHVEDAVEGIIAAMQFRSEKPEILELSSGELVTADALYEAAKNMLNPSKHSVTVPTKKIAPSKALGMAKSTISWETKVSLEQGLAKSLAWHVDRVQPYGPPPDLPVPEGKPAEAGDDLLKRLEVDTCDADDMICTGGKKFFPCASECSTKEKCLPSVFDSIVDLGKEVTEGCDVVLYTQEFGKEVVDLRLHAEYEEEDEENPNDKSVICNFAFISEDSRLVASVVQKVPDSELLRLGVRPDQLTSNKPGAFRTRKIQRLNGRLVYHGWILLWVDTPEANLGFEENVLLKISPGKLFHEDVKHALYVDQGFNISPKADDIRFLVSETFRSAWAPRIVKRKTRPKAKYLLPGEPDRQAVILMSELKYQESSMSERLPSSEHISVYEATRFMRYELGEEPLGKENPKVKMQREFYDRIPSFMNRDVMKSGNEPAHKFEMGWYARTRWVLHDLQADESRQLRCDWYQEHIEWGAPLDQLSFAYVMAKRNVLRKIHQGELDDNVAQTIETSTNMKKLLSDTFEWTAVEAPQNVNYTALEELRLLPYEMDYAEGEIENPEASVHETPLLFARIISDRIMQYARQTWSAARAAAEDKEAEEQAAQAEEEAKAAEEEAERLAAEAEAKRLASEEAARLRAEEEEQLKQQEKEKREAERLAKYSAEQDVNPDAIIRKDAVEDGKVDYVPIVDGEEEQDNTVGDFGMSKPLPPPGEGEAAEEVAP